MVWLGPGMQSVPKGLGKNLLTAVVGQVALQMLAASCH